MEYNFGYGTTTAKFQVNNRHLKELLKAKQVNCLKTEYDILKECIENPISSNKLKEIVKKGETVTIVTSDITRPMPSYKVLPIIIEELKKAKILERDITVVLALGSHRKHTDLEREKLVGKEIFNSEIRVLDNDINNCINFGYCKNGTPVDIFEVVANSDRVICLGNIEYHYFAGYSGGAKALMPGVSSYEAIEKNHRNMIKAEAVAGNLETNPVRQDIDEVAEHFKIDYILNVILNEDKRIIKAFSGHWKEAHREGCKILDEIYGVEIDGKADVVVVCPGGYPKDINLYQSHKALDNAKHAVKENGIIILVAECIEGFGEELFQEWMTNMSPLEMLNEIKRKFRLGGHKAAAIGQILLKNKIYWISSQTDELVVKIGMKPFESVQSAINHAISEKGDHSKILLMPYGGSTMPLVKNK